MNVIGKIELFDKVMEKLYQKTKRPVCRLQLGDQPYSLFDSHLGGVPYCPHDAEIPTDQTGQQLWLCAQINFSQLPQMDHFPERGILQIFLSEFNADGGFGLYTSEDWTIQESWKVVYYEEIDETVTMQEALSKLQVDWTEKEPWRIPGEPLKIFFSDLEYEGMSMYDYRFESTFEQAARELFPDIDPVSITIDEIYGSCETMDHRILCRDIKEKYSGHGCKIGGYLAYEQWDPREEREVPEWDVLLLQLDDRDKAPGFYLGGYGIANFWIRPEDLENGDFSRVGGEWTTS